MGQPLLRLLLFCLLLAAVTPGAAVGVVGQPLLQHFGPDQHGANPASFDVITLPDGTLLFANVDGILSFDGSHWSLFRLPGEGTARSLLLGEDGKVYVGGYDQLGRLERASNGQLSYVDMRADFGVADDKADFGVVWEVQSSREGVIYRTDGRLFFAGYDGRRLVWEVSENMRRLFVIGEQMYARVHGLGFSRIDKGEARLEPGGEVFASRALAMVFPRGDGRLLISEFGFFIADAAGVRKLPGAEHGPLHDYPPNAGLRLNDGSLVLGTDTGDLLHYSAELKLLGVHKIGPYSIQEMGTDREGGLWIVSERDLVRLRLPSPWSGFTASDGLQGAVNGTAYMDGALWVATSAGVFKSFDAGGRLRFALAVDTTLESYALLGTAHGLLVGEREGLLWHRPGQPDVRVLDGNIVFDIKRSEFDPETLWVIGESEVVRLRWADAGWQVLSRWVLDNMNIDSVIEVAADRIWLNNYRGEPQRWDYDPQSGEVLQRVAFGANEGLVVDPLYGTYLLNFDGQIFAVSGQAVFKLQGERFVAYDGEPFSRFEKPYEMVVVETPMGDFAYTTFQMLRRLPGTEDWQSMYLGPTLTRGFSTMRVDADGVLRVATWGGLLQFDPTVAEFPIAPLKVELVGFQLRPAQGEGQYLPLQPTATTELDLGAEDSLLFDYHMVTMDPGVEFRFRIDGLTQNWSEWTPPSRPALSLRNPGPGNYVLQVEGRTRLGRVGEALALPFRVMPAWWQTTPARLGMLFLAVLALLVTVHLFVRFRYRQYLAQNRQLELKITERTAELEQANRKLAELATEDSLTGVANRRAMEQGLNREWERCGELGQPLAVIMVDVDHFKQFNDRYGHLEGDQQLIRVARELSGRVRPVRELLARFGGEEFAIILPGTSLEEAAARAEIMRAAFDRETYATTVSVGVSAEVPGPGRSPTDLLRAADEALYAAKRGGRNRVVRAAA